MTIRKMLSNLEKIYSSRLVNASLWNHRLSENDHEIGFKSITVSKKYVKNNGEWGNSTTFSINDLPKAVIALQKAYEENFSK